MLAVYNSIPALYTGGTLPSTSPALMLATADTQTSKEASITPFGAMATERKSVADKIAGIAANILGVLGVEVNASGSGVQITRPQQMPQTVYQVGEPQKPIYENPLFIGGAVAILAVLLLRK